MAYFDYAATSIKRKNIFQELANEIETYEGNSSSSHLFGRNAKSHLEQARRDIAKSIGANENELIFTSGASESNNLVMQNFAFQNHHMIIPKIEHKSVLAYAKCATCDVTLVDSEANGKVNIEKIIESINEKTKFIALMLVNNETGVIQDVAKLGNYIKDKDIWLHVDAVQGFGHMDIDVNELNCDSMSMSGHKIGAMHGIGMLYLRKHLKASIIGGAHEFQMRAGTTNILGSVSVVKALREVLEEKRHIQEIKKYFIEKLKDVDHEINGDVNSTVDHILNVYFPNLKSDFLMTFLDMKGFCVSSGSACNSGSFIHSYVLENMYDVERASKSIRFSFGFTNTKEDVDKLVEVLVEANNKKKA